MCREVVDGLTDGEVSDCVIYRLYVGKQYTHKKKNKKSSANKFKLVSDLIGEKRLESVALSESKRRECSQKFP